jgi:hypothetical protein
MLKNKFLLYPVVLMIVLFCIDKVLLLDSIKKYIKSDFTYIYYESREDVFNLILADKEIAAREKKFMIILGSSRLLYFDMQEMKDFYPDWIIYNLSSAVTTPAYYYYYLEKLLDHGIFPDYVLLESDPNQFNENSPVFKGSNLTYSFDLPFVVRNLDLFGKDNFSFYLGKSLFAVGKNKPYLDTAYKRYKNPDFGSISAMQDLTKEYLLKNRGNAISLVDVFVEKNYAMLESTSRRTLDWVYAAYKPSEMQYAFYEKILQKLHEKKITTVIVWPQSSPPMQKLIKQAPFTEDWKTRVISINQKYGFVLRDMDNTDDYTCNTFVDGGHIAKDCYRPFLRYVMSEYFKEKTKK